MITNRERAMRVALGLEIKYIALFQDGHTDLVIKDQVFGKDISFALYIKPAERYSNIFIQELALAMFKNYHPNNRTYSLTQLVKAIDIRKVYGYERTY